MDAVLLALIKALEAKAITSEQLAEASVDHASTAGSATSAASATSATTATQVADQAGGAAVKVWRGNATAYAAVAVKDANTLYFVFADV